VPYNACVLGELLLTGSSNTVADDIEGNGDAVPPWSTKTTHVHSILKCL